MKVIIDTSILISFALNNESAKDIINKIEKGEYIMYVSPDILFEYKNVLRLKKFKFTKVYQNEILDLVNKYSTKITPDIETKFSRDKDDSAFLSLANYIDADILFTNDKTLQKADHLVKCKIMGI